MWEAPTPHHRELPAGHPHTALGKVFRGNRAHRTSLSPAVLRTSSAFSLHQLTCPCPSDSLGYWGCDSTSSSLEFPPSLSLSSPNLPNLPNPASPGKQGTDGSQQPGGNVQGEKGGRKNTSKSSTYFIGVKCLSDVLKGP